MRTRSHPAPVTAHAVAGTHAVLLGIDAAHEARGGLLGFAIEREDHTEQERYWLKGFKSFQETEPAPAPGTLHSTLEHPVQSFLWADYTAKPNHRYTYRVRPVRGEPKRLDYGPDIVVNVRTEDPDQGDHAVYFNRGAIASQAYARKFQNRPPAAPNDPADPATAWLSRGLLEGALAFIRQARGSRYGLRVAAYEFGYPPILDALAEAAASGADVQVVYEAGTATRNGVVGPTDATTANASAIRSSTLSKAGVRLHKRINRRDIPHNKFVVLLHDGSPRQVWTGSTNFTMSGFLGQSNVGHLVRDPAVSRFFNDYWGQLAADPAHDDLRAWNEAHTPHPNANLSDSTTLVFSPRSRSRMLGWYADRLGAAQQSAMFTAAFGVNKTMAEQFAVDRDFLRFIITESPLKRSQSDVLQRDRDTVVAAGGALGRDAVRGRIPGWELDRWYLQEEHFRKRGHVFYVHTKYLLLDALTEDPLVFSGSANFSSNSLLGNDENMLLIRGNTAVADVYLTEFLRLFDHFYFRTVANRLADRNDPRPAVHLHPTDGWVAKHFVDGSYHCRRREMLR